MRGIKKITLLFSLLFAMQASAQEFWSGEKYDVYISLGTNIGGTSPIPVPETVTEIKSWRAGINPSFGIYTTVWHPNFSQWGLNTGLVLEFKGMESSAIVRNFPVELVHQKMRMQGIFRGENNTKVHNGYIGIPIQVAYRSSGRFCFRFGGFVSYAGERSFKGIVRNGTLRKDLYSTSQEIIENSYDFSENIRPIDAGVLLSNDLYLRNKMSVNLDFSWGLIPIFKSDFKGIAYNLYNIYLKTAICYRW